MQTKILVNTKTIKVSDIEGLKLNIGDERVYKYLFGTSYSADNYTDMPEDVQVLLLPLKPLFYDLQVWTSDKIADPILVGVKKKFTAYKDMPLCGYAKGDVITSDKDFENKLKANGYKNDDDYFIPYDGKLYYILAQWGSEIFPLDELKNKAIELYKRENKVKLIKLKNEIQTDLDLIDDLADEYFRGNKGINTYTSYNF